VDLFVSESDVGNTYCFCIGSSALAISANFTPLLRRVVFVGEAVRGERRSELYRAARIDMRNAAGVPMLVISCSCWFASSERGTLAAAPVGPAHATSLAGRHPDHRLGRLPQKKRPQPGGRAEAVRGTCRWAGGLVPEMRPACPLPLNQSQIFMIALGSTLFPQSNCQI
jgi:hypothetical protein